MTSIHNILEDFKAKNFNQALIGIDKLLAKNPNHEKNINFKGIILNNLNQTNEARKCWLEAFQINNLYVEPVYNLAESFLIKKDYNEAIKYFIKASKLQSKNFLIYFKLGFILMEKRNLDEAIKYFKKSLTLNNKFSDTYFNLAVVYNLLNKKEKSILCFQSVIKLNPNDVEAYYNLAISYRETGDLQMAEKVFETALKINPNYPYLKGQLRFTKNHLCNWDNFSEDKAQIEDNIKESKKVIRPWQSLTMLDSAELLLKNSLLFNKEKNFRSNFALHKNKKIILGYFSPDFCDHAVSNQLKKKLKLHNRKKFEIIGFYFNTKKDKQHNEIKNYFDKFFYVNQESNENIIRLAKNLKIDIAIDLCGFTNLNRYQIFSQRCAPIQVSYLGYAGSTGLKNIDYLIADKTVVPTSSRKFYSEKIIYMPKTFMPGDDTQKFLKNNYKKINFGITNENIVYCCFNSCYKILPNIFDCWVEILKKVKNSILWLNISNKIAKKNIINYAEKNNLDSQRIFFTDKTNNYHDYLSKQSLADIFLDTYPYSAHSTGYASLISGVPIVTCKSETFANNVCSSLLVEADLSELIASNLSDYKKIAINLGQDRSRLNDIKKKLKNNIEKKKMFNNSNYIDALENAYQKVYELKKNNIFKDIVLN